MQLQALKRRPLSALLLATTLSLSALCATAATSTDKPASALISAPFADAQPITLTEQHLERFLAAATELKTLNIDMDQGNREQASIEQWSDAIRKDPQVSQVVSRHGFATPEDFALTSYSVMMALGALQLRNHQAEIEQAKEQLRQMRDQLDPETYAMLEQQMLGALDPFAAQPQGNTELVGRYETQLAALADK